MSVVRRSSQLACGVLLLAGGAWLSAQQTATIPYEPPKQFGTSVTGAFEGWFDSADGNTHNFLVGYFNRNLKQPQDIPIGPNNRIEPGGPDLGQPTHFLSHRRTGVFIVPVPKSFSPDQKLTWTLTVNGQTTQIPLRLHRDYNVNPFSEVAIGNTPPVVKLGAGGTPLQGPVALLSKAPALTAAVGTPLTLTASVDDDGKFASATMAPVGDGRSPVNLQWIKYRGPGAVTFDQAQPKLAVAKGGKINEPFSGTGTTTAKFAVPGEYALMLLATDYSGEGGNGEVCCWTNAYVRVTVK